jgi:steroid 5-alpha reductase family enzyme
MTSHPDRAASRRTVLRAYVAILASALLTWWLAPWSPQVALAAGLAVSAVVTFVFILTNDNGSVFDPWWSVMPPVAALWLIFGVSDTEVVNARQVAVLAVTGFWGVRLTLNWWRDWPGLHHEDWRFRELAAKSPLPVWVVRFGAVVVSQTLFVIGGLLPLHPALVEGGAGFGLLDALALTVGIGATALELVADEQMKLFAETKAPGDVMDRGLWRFSRHPNYLGEIGFWLSLWLFALAANPAAWWTGIGVAAIFAMFRFASIPMLDARSAQRRPAFERYAARTPALFPRRIFRSEDEAEPADEV